MTDPTENSEEDFATYISTVQLTLDALKDWLKPADAHSNVPTESIKINALDLAHDTASIIRAQLTKLYLLIRSKPFPPSAPNRILHELISGPIPSLVYIAKLCDPKIYTQTMSNELDYRLNRLVAELTKFVRGIPVDRDIVFGRVKNDSNGVQEENVLLTIGTIWEACDALIGLRDAGISGLFIRKSEEYRDLLEDAFEELQEWGKELNNVEDDHELDFEDDEYITQSAENHIFASQKHIPNDDPDKIRPRLVATTKRLRLLILMFQAIIKRRFKTLSGLPNLQPDTESNNQNLNYREAVRSLDCALEAMKKISDIIDDLACSFYDLDVFQIDIKMDECFSVGTTTPELLINNWQGERDGFSSWVTKFQNVMRSEEEGFKVSS